MKKNRRALCFFSALLLLLSLTAGLFACADSSGADTPTGPSAGSSSEKTAESPSAPLEFDDIDLTVTPGNDEDDTDAVKIELTGTTAVSSSDAVEIDGGRITIRSAGSYTLTGLLEDGQILVDAAKSDKIELILNGADITSKTSAAIYVRTADKVTIRTAEGSVNSLANGGTYTAIDENNIDAVLFSKDDLVLSGGGTLAVKAAAGHGVVSKDDLEIQDGTYILTAAGHGLSANDSITVSGGTLSVTAGKDGFHAANSEDSSLGNILIEGGELGIVSSGDGVSADGTLTVDAGYLSVTAGGGAKKTVSDTSAKGLKSAGNLVIKGGTFVLDCADDAIHSNADVTLSGGVFTIATGDDGVHADEALVVSGGSITVTESYEGLEGLSVEITGGTLSLRSSDDGINAAGGQDASGFGGPGGDRFGPGGIFGKPGQSGSGSSDSSSSSYIRIAGGSIEIRADGDGVDSNGTLEISGGTLYISGPTSSANGALDFDSSGVITGGCVVAVGAAGMAQNFGSASTQGAILVNVGSQAAGTAVTLADSDGNLLLSYEPLSAYSSVLISCPELAVGKTYTLTAGSARQTITLTSLLYGGGFGGNGGFGGRW